MSVVKPVMQKQQLDKLIRIYELLVDVLDGIGEDPKTNPHTLTKLSAVTDARVQASVALNPSTPGRILQKMLKLHPGCGGEDEEWRIHIVGNPALPLRTLRWVVDNDQSPDVREAALTALAIRTSKSSKVTSRDLLKLYTRIDKTETVSDGRRQRAAKNSLLKNPKFPKWRLDS